MKHAVPLFLEDDTIAHIDWVQYRMSSQMNKTVSRSEVVAWLVKKHWKKMRQQATEKGLVKEDIL